MTDCPYKKVCKDYDAETRCRNVYHFCDIYNGNREREHFDSSLKIRNLVTFAMQNHELHKPSERKESKAVSGFTC